MTLSLDFLNAHILELESLFLRQYLPHRAKWPSRLFHHTAIDNAVSILRSGFLRSRLDVAKHEFLDVAGSDVISARDRAHNFVRLYFRPRTPTQFYVEGIRRVADCWKGEQDVHAPILIMFVCDIRQILTLPGVRFSASNMQSCFCNEGDTEAFFRSIRWSDVYHQGPTKDGGVIKRRCAEVLCPSPLNLRNVIQWVYCRSNAERATLIYMLGQDASLWRDKIKVSDDIQVFDKRFTYIENVAIQEAGISFRIHPRWDDTEISVEITAKNQDGKNIISFSKSKMAPVPHPHKTWIIRSKIDNGTYNIHIKLEGKTAYINDMVLEDLPF